MDKFGRPTSGRLSSFLDEQQISPPTRPRRAASAAPSGDVRNAGVACRTKGGKHVSLLPASARTHRSAHTTTALGGRVSRLICLYHHLTEGDIISSRTANTRVWEKTSISQYPLHPCNPVLLSPFRGIIFPLEHRRSRGSRRRRQSRTCPFFGCRRRSVATAANNDDGRGGVRTTRWRKKGQFTQLR